MSKTDDKRKKPTVQRLGPSVPAGRSAQAGSCRSSANDCRVSEEGNQSSGASNDWKQRADTLIRQLSEGFKVMESLVKKHRTTHCDLKTAIKNTGPLSYELRDLWLRNRPTEASQEVVVATADGPGESDDEGVAQTPEATSVGNLSAAKPSAKGRKGGARTPAATTGNKTETGAPIVSKLRPKAKEVIVARPAPRESTQERRASAKRPPRTAPEKARSPPPSRALPLQKTTTETSKSGGPMEGRKQRGKKEVKERRRGNPAPDPVLTTGNPLSSERVRKKRKRLDRVPTPALLIRKAPPSAEATATPPPARSFADVIRRITELASETSPTITAKSVSRTRKGDLLIRVAGAAYHQLAEIATKAADPGMVVERLLPKRTVVLKDIDLSITTQDVSRALGAAFEPEDSDQLLVHSLRPGHSGTQCCTARVPDTGKAKRLIKDGRIKIGLVMCRVRERRAVLQCYRCLGYGHIAHGCKAMDRSKLCRVCMQTGHQMGSCPNDPWCPLCAEIQNGSRGAAHRLGGGNCTALKRAISGRRT
jgi:hypothetical protein